MKIDRLWSIVVAVLLFAGILTGCGSGDKEALEKQTEVTDAKMIKGDVADFEKKSIVCTTFPQYDWMRNVLGDRQKEFDLILLLDSGMDLHSYQPTAEDMARISACDMFVYVGGASDGWVKDALKEVANDEMQVVNLMELLGKSAKEEEIVEGMQKEEHEHVDAENDSGEGTEYDEHVWLSLKNAQVFVTALAQSMGLVDQEYADVYKANAESYNKQLKALDDKYTALSNEAKTNVVLFGDRFPFRYLVDDYGWNYYAAFAGCSAETEASFETIAFLAGKLDELKLRSIFVLEGSDQKIAEAIINSTKEKTCEIISVNSMQAVTKKDVEASETYLGVMEDNLAAFEKALK